MITIRIRRRQRRRRTTIIIIIIQNIKSMQTKKLIRQMVFKNQGTRNEQSLECDILLHREGKDNRHSS